MIVATQVGNGEINLVGKQGTTWEFNIDVYTDDERTTAADLSTYSARGQYREEKDDVTPAVTFTCTINDNRVNVLAEAALSSATSVYSGVYDIEIYNADGSSVERIAEGTLVMSQEVTK